MDRLTAPLIVESDSIPSPALIFFEDRIRRNIERAITAVGDPDRLRPHVKSHKCPQVVRMQIDSGVAKFKCATLAEARMLALSGAKDVLLAYQPVGPNIGILLDLIERYPGTIFSCIVDHPRVLSALSHASSRRSINVPIFVDFDVGMNRTGVQDLKSAASLGKQIQDAPGTLVKGIHAYDGHHTDPDPAVRKAKAAETVETVGKLINILASENMDVEEIVVSGTPMFAFYTDFSHLTLSPGTLFLHDYNSFIKYPDLKFEFGAMILSRIISLPGKGGFTIDAGKKAISADDPEKAKLISLPDAQPAAMSEEHWRFTCKHGTEPEISDAVLLIPAHVCTAVHHFDKAYVFADNGKRVDTWDIAARGRM